MNSWPCMGAELAGGQCFFWKRSILRKCVGTRPAMESISVPGSRAAGKSSAAQLGTGAHEAQGKPHLPHCIQILRVNLNKDLPRLVWNSLYLHSNFKACPRCCLPHNLKVAVSTCLKSLSTSDLPYNLNITPIYSQQSNAIQITSLKVGTEIPIVPALR